MAKYINGVETIASQSATIVIAASNSLHKERADYVCDGTADQVEIQAAINALPAGGGKVLLLEGLYNITVTISIPDNAALEGQGTNTILKAAPSRPTNFAVLSPNGVSNIHIVDLKIDGNKSNQDAGVGVFYGINFVGVTDSKIEGVTIIDCGLDIADSGYGIIFNQSSRNTISHCNISGAKLSLITIYNGGGNNLITECILKDSEKTGITVHACNRTIISSNIITSMPTYGIYIHTSGDGNIVNNNIIELNGTGVNILSQTNCGISANYISAGGIGISIDSNCKRCTVGHNSIYNSGYGIFINGSGIIVSGNALNTLTAAYGIQVSASASRITIAKNFIADAATWGIQVRSNYHIIEGNYCYQNDAGIYLNGAEHCLVSNNIVSDNGGGDPGTQNGIYVDAESHYNLIIGNTGQKGTQQQRGIRLFNGTKANVIASNYIDDIGTIEGMQDLNTYSTNIIYNKYSDIFMDALAASSNAVHADITGTGAEQEVTTAITNPDVPRNISITNSANSTGDVVITGVDAKGNSVTDTVTIVTGGIAYGVVAFSTVSKITIPATVANPDTISVGISDKLGLSNVIYASSDVYKVKVNNADDPTIGTVSTTYDTVDCATINAADDITIWYRSNLNIIA